MFYVYFITNKHNTVLYTGMTHNLNKRVSEHFYKYRKGFSNQYNVDKLVYYETYGDWRSAFNRERQLKGWARAKKENLINKENPEWLSLNEV